jgi:hypothetical protein
MFWGGGCQGILGLLTPSQGTIWERDSGGHSPLSPSPDIRRPYVILTPKVAALDSSHWSKWLRDVFSPDPGTRREARRFPDRLLEGGYTILLCWHHLQELLAHGNRHIAAKRLRFVREIPFLSWIGTVDQPEGLGSIIDVMAAEAIAITAGATELSGIRSAAKSLLLKSGSAHKLIPDDPLFFSIMHEWAQRRADKARTITAIAPITFIDPKKTIGELMEGSIRTPQDRDRVLMAQHQMLTEEILLHGDHRITNPHHRTNAFMKEVLALAPKTSSSTREFVLGALALQGIDEDEVDAAATMDELGRLGVFRSQLRVAAPKTGVAFASLKRKVRAEQMPHRIISEALRAHGQNFDERSGGELNDGYLATLAAYADVLFVDKRTHENFRRATQKDTQLKKLVGGVSKASNYKAICDMLRTLS